MMTPFPPKLIAARHCEHWRTRACARVGSLRFARFGFPPPRARVRAWRRQLCQLWPASGPGDAA